jgi:hypothetical protein
MSLGRKFSPIIALVLLMALLGGGRIASSVSDFLAARKDKTILQRAWNDQALRAILEAAIPFHNAVAFVYRLENRTSSDYEIDSGTQVQLREETRRGRLVSRSSVVSEGPVIVPAHGITHYSITVTMDQDVDPKHMPELISALAVDAFVLFDLDHGYRLRLPVN